MSQKNQQQEVDKGKTFLSPLEAPFGVMLTLGKEGKGRGGRQVLTCNQSATLSVGNLGWEGRRGLAPCLRYGEAVLVLRENHTGEGSYKELHVCCFVPVRLLRGSRTHV